MQIDISKVRLHEMFVSALVNRETKETKTAKRGMTQREQEGKERENVNKMISGLPTSALTTQRPVGPPVDGSQPPGREVSSVFNFLWKGKTEALPRRRRYGRRGTGTALRRRLGCLGRGSGRRAPGGGPAPRDPVQSAGTRVGAGAEAGTLTASKGNR